MDARIRAWRGGRRREPAIERAGVSRPSSVDRLPAEMRDAIGRLRDAGHTIDEIMAHLADMESMVSRSALGGI